jgi:hypothetical protein
MTMTTIKLKEFGAILTGRDFGKSTLKVLTEKFRAPVELDFEGVFSMGSSFGDEVIPTLANAPGGHIKVLNANNVVRTCIETIVEETKIKVTLE